MEQKHFKARQGSSTSIQTKATSTPNSKTNRMSSPSLSALSGISGATTAQPAEQVESHDTLAESILNLSLSSWNGDSDLELDTITPSKRRRSTKISNTGRDWNAFKPKHKLSFYYFVTMEPERIKDIAFRWVNMYQQHEYDAMVFMIQFFIDIASYQDYDVSKHYKRMGSNAAEIINDLEKPENISSVIINYTYLLATHSDWSKKTQSAVYDFIVHIITISDYRGVLMNCEMITELLQFLKLMSSSKVRALRHTGAVLAMKFALPCAQVFRTMHEKLKVYQQSFLNETRNMEKIKKAIQKYQLNINNFSKILKYLQHIIIKNSSLQDPALESVRAVYALDMYGLLAAVPEFYFKAKSITLLIQFLCEESKNVRLNSLLTFMRLLKTTKYSVYLESSLQDIFVEIDSKMFDRDYDIAALAVDVFTLCLKTYPNEISTKTINSILRMVYCRNYRMGAAAGKFLLEWIHKQQDISEASIIKRLVRFHHMPQMRQLTPLLVESIIDCAPELHHYHTIIEVLIRDKELVYEDEVILLEILKNTVHQVATGKASILRENYRQGSVNLERNQKMAYDIIPHLNYLIKKYSCEECLKYLVEIMLVFDYQECSLAQLQDDLMVIITSLQDIFIKSADMDLLEAISKLFILVCDDLCPLEYHASALLEMLIGDVTSHYNVSISNLNVEASSSNILRMEAALKKLAVIYKHFDLTNQQFTWILDTIRTVCPEITKINENSFVYDLECGEYAVLWDLRKFLQADVEEGATHVFEANLNKLKDRAHQYLDICFTCLSTMVSSRVQAKSLWCICNFLQEFNREIDRTVKNIPNLLDLVLEVKEENKQKLLLKALREIVFDAAVPASFGYKYLAIFINTIMARHFPLAMLHEVFSHYQNFYEQYGKLFDDTLRIFEKIGTIALHGFITSTLINRFLYIDDVKNFRSEESINLTKLALRFGLFTTRRHLVAILQLGIKFALKAENNLPFLHWLECLCRALQLPDRKKVLTFLKSQQDDIFKNNEHVISFTNKLRTKQVKKKYVTLPLSEETADTSATNVSATSGTTTTETLIETMLIDEDSD